MILKKCLTCGRFFNALELEMFFDKIDDVNRILSRIGLFLDDSLWLWREEK